MLNYVYYAILILSFFTIEELSMICRSVFTLHSAPIEWLFANVFSNSKHSFTTIRSDQAMFTYNCICLQIERQSLTSSVAQSILSQCHFNTLIFQFFSPVEESLTFLVTKAYSQWYVYQCLLTIVFAFLYRANRRSLTYSVTQSILSQWHVRRMFFTHNCVCISAPVKKIIIRNHW